MDGRNYDIAVVGESMAGKSTWISALCREDVAEMLGEIHRENKQGQTKTAVHYLLKDTEAESFYVESVKWNYEKLIDSLQAGQEEQVEKLLASLGLSLGKMVSDKDMEKELKKYLESGEAIGCIRKSQNMSGFVKNVVNNKEFGESGIISCLEISVPAASEVWKEISDRGLDCVRIRDTRGFLDESVEKMQEFLEKVIKRQKEDGVDVECTDMDSKTICIQEMLDERGISGTDAVVFMGVSNSNALCKENIREMYKPLIADMLGKHPVFLTVRTDEMTKLMMRENNTYQENYSKILKDKSFSGLDDLRGLVEEYRKLPERQGDFKTDIARKNYHELLLPNISRKMLQEDKTLEKKFYRPCAFSAFREVMEGIRLYHKSIETAEQCLQTIGNPTAKLNELYSEVFDKKIDYHNYKEPRGRRYFNRWFGYQTIELADKLKGPYIGGMVGAWGGLTTYDKEKGERVGKFAILMLEAVYRMEESLLPKLLDELEPEIEKYVSQKVDEARISEAVKEEKEHLYEKFTQHLRKEYEKLSCTSRMVKREYLEKVCKKTKNYFEKEDFNFEKYFPELEGRYPDDEWKRDKLALAVVKYAAWKLMISHLHWNDTEEDNG